MEKLQSLSSLRITIAELEHKRINQEIQLGEDIRAISESLRPVNILKRTFHDLIPGLGSIVNLLTPIIGLGTGMLAKIIIAGKSPGLLKRITATAVQWGIAAAIAKKSGKINSHESTGKANGHA
jgi:hypothetical protein